jgi:hypothetical protein
MLDSLNLPRFDMWRQKHWSGVSHLPAPEYCIIARMKLVDKDFWLDGAILQISSEFARFRETSLYILKRRNEEVVIEIEDSEHPAYIITTENYGYRIEFVTPLPDVFVAELRERWRIDS